jgi:hypothetical protein
MPTPDSRVSARTTGSADQALVARAAALLHTNGQSTAVTLAAVDRLNTGLGTGFTLIPSWTSSALVGASVTPLITPAPPTSVAMRSVAAVMTAVDAVADRRTGRAELTEALDRARCPSAFLSSPAQPGHPRCPSSLAPRTPPL